MSLSSSTVLVRRRFRGRIEAESDVLAGARADDDRCGEGRTERLGSVMIVANSATIDALELCYAGAAFASVRGTYGTATRIVFAVIQSKEGDVSRRC